MQSLGKVPSARRPPANLPSLKAETSTPNDSSWGESDGLNQQNTASTGNQLGAGGNDKTVKSTTNGPHSGPSSLSNSAYSNNSSNQPGGGANANSGASWSSLTTGGQIEAPPTSSLYQNPQFQQEFPSLDGSGTPASKGRGAAHDTQNNGAGGGDGPLSLRPQTDASQWQQNQQQNQQSGQNSQTNQPAPAPQLPPQLRAVMPSFMYRSSGGAQGSGAGTGFGGYTSNSNANQYGLPDEQNSSNYNSSSGGAQPFNKRSSGAGGNGGQRRGGPDDRRGDRYDRPQRRGPPLNRSNRHDYAQDDDYVEPKFSGE